MPAAFTTLWTQHVCRELRKDRIGCRPPVAFSGIHQSLPRWSSVGVGDTVHAVHVSKCVVYLVSQLEVIDKERRDCCGPAPASYREPAHPGHADWRMLGAEDCGAEPVHVEATPIRFDTPVPGDLLTQLTWRNRRGETRGLKYVVDGRLERFVSLQGVYQLTDESAGLLAGLVADARLRQPAVRPAAGR